jgi:hypothetical protein
VLLEDELETAGSEAVWACYGGHAYIVCGHDHECTPIANCVYQYNTAEGTFVTVDSCSKRVHGARNTPRTMVRAVICPVLPRTFLLRPFS